MGEAQWIQPTVRNRLSQAIILTNFTILYGKFYDINDPYTETQSPQGTKIDGQAQFEWGQCGREGSPSGTEASFEVRLVDGDEKIAKIYWDCPWSGSNKLTKSDVKDGYDISFDGFSIPSGPLGKGKINVRED